MTIEGKLLIGSASVVGKDEHIHAVNPTDGGRLEPAFAGADAAQVDQACRLAAEAFDIYRETTPADRAKFLNAIADNIIAIGDVLIERAGQETGLPAARLTGERARTVGQLRLFAEVVLAGNWVDARLDSALPDRQPLPRSDLRQRHIGLGPVAVFGASNFPLAFSVGGGDTASALAAGCPVVAKAHPAHLGTSELVGHAIRDAVEACGLPEGVFSLVLGAGTAIGQTLVSHPEIKAVGFTGSRGGGTALMAAAAARPEPIPVYAEMSSINPVLLLPQALASRPVDIAKAYIASLTMGAGQFCTNPGLVLAVEGPGFDAFVEAAGMSVRSAPPATMLTSGIHKAYTDGIERLTKHAEPLAAGVEGGLNQSQAGLFSVTADQLLASAELQEEVFGPSSVIVRCTSTEEMQSVLAKLEGQLTITLQMDAGDTAAAKALLPTLERKAGRILVNGFPTGVEVSHAMVHGGPYPSTSDGRSTSVGTLAIRRFLRPVCYQDFPADLLPTALEDNNPLGLWRLVDGEMGKA